MANWTTKNVQSRPGASPAFMVVIGIIVALAAVCYYGFIEQ